MDNLKYALRYDIRYIRKGSIEVPHPHSGFKWTVDVFYFEVPYRRTSFSYAQYYHFTSYNLFVSDYLLRYLNSMLNRRYWEI